MSTTLLLYTTQGQQVLFHNPPIGHGLELRISKIRQSYYSSSNTENGLLSSLAPDYLSCETTQDPASLRGREEAVRVALPLSNMHSSVRDRMEKGAWSVGLKHKLDELQKRY